jgi:pimeloyl-ACP methyl ester carboxylesterase
VSVSAAARAALASAISLAAVLAGACSSTEPAIEGVSTHVVRYQDCDVAYSERGAGREAIVFVHGWACDRSFWNGQIGEFGARHVIAVDLPGHGESTLPSAPLTMDLFARSIAAVLQDAHVERAVLVGHSNGTPVVRQFYRWFPERTEALVIVDGALKAFFDDPSEADQFLEPLRGKDYLASATQFVDGMLPSTVSDENRNHIRRVMLATPQRTMVEGMQAALDPAIWRPDPIRVPVLVVLARSPFWDAEYEAFVRKLCPDVDYRTMIGVSHFLMLDRPKEFNAELESFLGDRHLGGSH